MVDGYSVGMGDADLDFRELTRDELRKVAADYGIAGRGKMSKTELLEAVESAFKGV